MSGYVEQELFSGPSTTGSSPAARVPVSDSAKGAWDASERSEESHQERFTDEDMDKLRADMEARNNALEKQRAGLAEEEAADEAEVAAEEEALMGEEEAEAVEMELGPLGWLAAGMTALAIAATLAALGYSLYEIATLQKQVAMLPPDASMPLPPPGKVPTTPPKTVFFGVNPALWITHKKRSRRVHGFM